MNAGIRIEAALMCGRSAHELAHTASRILMAAAFVANVTALFAVSDAADTFFLRDGSVVRGGVVNSPDGTMLVDTEYGCLAVDQDDVLFRVTGAEPDPVVSETYVLGGSANSAVLTALRHVPAPIDNATTFSLLVTGHVTAVRDRSDQVLAYQAIDAGPVTRVILRYSDVAKSRYVNVTAQLNDALEQEASGTLRLAETYTVDQSGRARVAVRYPQDWKLQSAAPAPAKSAEGLIVWEQDLGRQQQFAPQAEFKR